MKETRNIVITGASGGIGAALAVQLGAGGHRVALAARREAELKEVASRCGAGAIAVATDVTRRADVDRLRDRALEAFGHVDVWVNNAGRGITRPVLDLKDDEFDAIMAVNVKSALYGMQTIAPHFIARGRGHIINVSSFLSRVPFATFRSAYNAAKAALNALTANARVDLAAKHQDVHVSLVMPGLVSTEFQKNAIGGTPQVRLGTAPGIQTADEVAAAIVELIAHPKAEIYTNPQHGAIVLKYFSDVGAFERENAAAR
ncbi:MAG: SDR family oxidoreductase [Acidobacteriia bacterium]|nr:SDR family oxidoreductase [Terriglobia bacterium]